MGSRQVSRTAIVATTPEKIFGLLADPAQHPLIDGSGTVRAAQPGGPDRLSLGATFGMDMKLGPSYKILNIRAQEGGCGHALGEATEQTGDRVVVNLSETKAQTGQMCTMDIRYPVISVALAAPLDQRKVVLKTTPPR